MNKINLRAMIESFHLPGQHDQSTHAGFGSTTGTATAQAHPGGRITVDKSRYKSIPVESRKSVLAHELVHETVEDYVLKNSIEWDAAEKVLTVSENSKGMKLFLGGQTRIGEAVAEMVGAYLMKDTMPGASSQVYDWARDVIKRSGNNEDDMRSWVEGSFVELEKELE